MSAVEFDYTDGIIKIFGGLGGFEGFIFETKQKPNGKTYSVTGKEYDSNEGKQSLPEQPGRVEDQHDLTKLEIVGYMQGEYISVKPKLTWFHFLRVQVVNQTKHPITKKKRTTVLAWTKNNNNAPVLLICKTKTK